ncbi:MAG: threonine-phosphate decarboxylase, partial [Candidatus Omnitrophica bacterium]|nr:threonine-phosphate decarboxylase [Candidatus Omnitrophota bacterium]
MVIQVCGTGSGVGKSVIVSALCRIFLQDGLRPCPFKAQNMALNSFVTADGKEMGRAQAVQAQAAGLVPCADMNPILLKPMSDRRAQVVVSGIPARNMSVYEYVRYKKTAESIV